MARDARNKRGDGEKIAADSEEQRSGMLCREFKE